MNNQFSGTNMKIPLPKGENPKFIKTKYQIVLNDKKKTTKKEIESSPR